MAHKKAGGSTRNGRDSKAKRLGVKVYGNQTIGAGAIIIRQKGNSYWPGEGVSQGVDFTLFATKPGKVVFSEKNRERYDGRVYKKTMVSVK